MLDNWLRPPASDLFDDDYQPHQLGASIRIYGSAFPSLDEVGVALVGIGGESADAVRRELYRLSFPFARLVVADLGNARRDDANFVIPLLQELLSAGICPVVIGAAPRLVNAQVLACQGARNLYNWTHVDERLRFEPAGDPSCWLAPVLKKATHLFHFSHIGHQAHFTSSAALRHMEDHFFDLARLGKVRANPEEAEPLIRDADLLTVHLAALKYSEAPGQENPSPNGFTAEELCQLARYAGMSDKLSSLGIYGFRHDLDVHGQTAQVVAQATWYFLDGFANRKRDYPVATDSLVEYAVDTKDTGQTLTFWKSSKSGRWWMQVPVKTRKKHDRHRLVPCSYSEYLLACQDELPERLLNAMRRFG